MRFIKKILSKKDLREMRIVDRNLAKKERRLFLLSDSSHNPVKKRRLLKRLDRVRNKRRELYRSVQEMDHMKNRSFLDSIIKDPFQK